MDAWVEEMQPLYNLYFGQAKMCIIEMFIMITRT